MMYTPLSTRQNPNLPKLLSLLLVLLTLALLYQHYSNKQVQGVLERDISISRQRAKQVEKELDAIQKGLQLDLNKEKSENEKVKNELQQVKFQMESMANQHSQKERTCQQYYEELEGCRSEKESCIENVDKLSISVSQCVGEKNANIQSINNMQLQADKASSERLQMTSQIEMLQSKLTQRETELQQLMLRAQGQGQGQRVPIGVGQPLAQGQGQPMIIPNQFNQPGNQPGAQNFGGNPQLNQQQFAAGFANNPNGMNNQLPFNNPNMPQNYQQQLALNGQNRNNALYLDKQQQQPVVDNNGRPPVFDQNAQIQPKVENQEPVINPPAAEIPRKAEQKPDIDSSANDIAKVPQNWRGQELVVNKDESAEAARVHGNAGPVQQDAVVGNRGLNPNEFNGDAKKAPLKLYERKAFSTILPRILTTRSEFSETSQANSSQTGGRNATKHVIISHKDALNSSKINMTATNKAVLASNMTRNVTAIKANSSQTVGRNATKHAIASHNKALNASKINITATNKAVLVNNITRNLEAIKAVTAPPHAVNETNSTKAVTAPPHAVNETNSTKAAPQVDLNPPVMQPPQQVGAPGEDKHVQNPAEVDHVPGDGQGALLPPMGQAERKAMEDRINNGGVAQQDAQLYKRGEPKPDLLEEPKMKAPENIGKDDLDFPIGAPEGDRNLPEEEEDDEEEEDRPIEANIEDQKPDNDRNDQLFDANEAAPGEKRDYNKNEVNNEKFGNGQELNVQNVAPNEKDALNNDFHDINDKDVANIPDFEQNRK
ncbi:uncharacterized protein LOC142343942 isoform X4 [Convolutriloba macropyga]|uniref:uncharacterized protein LOC142343942 isoform X3 n=1 Tax=Convolutriloba macropyga TaxID=536237 RepID=UPI003F51AC96